MNAETEHAEYMAGRRDAHTVVRDNGIAFAQQWRHAMAMADDDATDPIYVVGVCDALDDYES